MVNLNKLYRYSKCLFLGIAFSGVFVSVYGQSTKTGGDSSQGSVWVNNSILEEAPYVNAERVENRGYIEAGTPDNVPFYFFNTALLKLKIKVLILSQRKLKHFIIILLVKLLV